MNNETLDNIKVQLEEDYIDFGIHDKDEIELLITMVKTYENWKALKEWLKDWVENEEYCSLAENPKDRCRQDIYNEVLDKMNELESDKE